MMVRMWPTMRFLQGEESKLFLNRAVTPLDCEWSRQVRSEIFYVAASLGFEPRQRDSESLVLPLHHEARSEENKDRCASLQV